MKLILVCVVLFAVAANAAKRYKKPIEEYFRDFAGEEDIHLITDEDNRPPTNFVGDVMKAQTTSIKTLTGSKKFNYNFETQNGINVASIGKLKDGKTFVVSGSYSYTGADGKRYRVRYTADEFGYHPVTELDDQPEIVITPAPPAAPVAPYKFAKFSSFNNGNQFGGQNNRVGKQFGGQNGLFGDKNSQYGEDSSFDGYGYNNGNGQGNNGYGAQNNLFGGSNGQFGKQGGFYGPNGIYGEQTGQGTFAGYNNYNGNGQRHNGPYAANGFNTINRFGSFDRTGKSLLQNDLVFNKNFISASPIQPENPNRLYLPTATQTYLPPQ